MKILLALSNYINLTGSEIYTYELARVLKSRGHQVTIMANRIGGDIVEHTKEHGIEIKSLFQNMMDHTEQYDIIHAAQPGPTVYCLRTYPNLPLVTTIHSQLIYERPIYDERIKKYICIRPQIQEMIIDGGIPKSKTVLIYNGVDRNRFNTKETVTNPAILFVGTFDHLRTPTIQELVERARSQKKELWLVSSFPDDVKAKFPKHVKVIDPNWNVEKYNKDCSETASVYLGRTTIEGWMCGKPGLIYDVDDKGLIKSVDYADVPDEKTLSRFDIEYMADKILETYTEVINAH